MKRYRNARFWVWINDGAVKLTLRPSQSLEHYRADSTEEGWSSEWHRWTHEVDRLLLENATDGRDCDGRLQRYHEAQCRIDRLDAHRIAPSPYHREDCPCCEGDLYRLGFPSWQTVDESQRDYSAEAAGY